MQRKTTNNNNNVHNFQQCRGRLEQRQAARLAEDNWGMIPLSDHGRGLI